MSSAGCRLIQTSTERAHRPAVLLGERFESGIIRNPRIALHGLRRQRLTALPLHPRRRISRVMGTTTVVIAEIVITIKEAKMVEAAGLEAVSTLTIGAEVRLVALISSLLFQ